MERINILREERAAFKGALEALNQNGIRYVVGGAFAMHFYTGVWRYTKDLDIFLLPNDVQRALNILQRLGYHTRVEAENWLAKAFKRDYMIDLIFGEGNWLHQVDERWIEHGKAGSTLGVPTRIAPIEEIIWSKAYVAERTRYDGADIVRLLNVSKGKLDWRHLLDRFDDHWELLFSYLNLFRFVYPTHKNYVPEWVMKELIERMQRDLKEAPPRQKICRGTMLDRLSYIHDVEEQGYHDPREELAVAIGYSVRDVFQERRWAAKKVHQRELHAA